MEALRKKSGNRPRWHDTKTGSENLLKNYKKRLDELNFSCITDVEIGETINKNMKTNPITTLIKSAVFAVAFAGVAQAATLTYDNSVNADTNDQTFTFSKFDTSLGSLTAIDLIINSSTPGGNFTLTRTSAGSGNATFTQFRESLSIFDDFDTIFDSALTPITVSGNASIARPSTNLYTVNGGQSLLSSSPWMASIASGAWSLYESTGAGTITLTAGLTADPTYTSGKNVSSNTANLFAATSMTLRYTYTASAPSGVPEPRQVAASLLVLVGVGGYAFMKRKKTPVAV